MKKTIWIIVIVLVLAGMSFLIIKKSQGKAEAKVETGTVGRKELTSLVNCSGTIQPKRKVDVSANAMGTIVHLAVVEGQQVTAGDLLMEIDPAEYKSAVLALEATIRSAQADVTLAEASLDKAVQDRDRTKELLAEGIASQEQWVAAQTTARVEQARLEAARHRIEQYEANLSRAHHDLKKVTLTAPMSGVITRLNVEEGENAIMGTLNNPGTVLLVIADLGTMEAWVEVDETEVVKVELGQDTDVTIDAFPDKTFHGTVTEIGNSPVRRRTGASREAVDFEVKITLDETVPNIRPGLSAKAEITVAKRDSAMAVPLGAVTVRDWPLKVSDIRRYNGRRAAKQKDALEGLGFEALGKNTEPDEKKIERKETEGAFILQNGFVKFVPVEIGIAGEDDFEIISGLSEGQTVVTGPFRILRELKDGAQVALKKKDKKNRSGKSDD